MIQQFLQENRRKISAYIEPFLEKRMPELGIVHPLGSDIVERLREFTVRGKMIRGSLAVLGSMLFTGRAHPDAVPLGAAMELFQSALLVHDDIMDRDPYRRGYPSLYHQYSLYAGEKGVAETGHTGESLGICAGDIAFFLGYEILGSVAGASAATGNAVRYCSRELAGVAAAQMGDVLNGVLPSPLSEKEIITLYTNKTGRYTFSMPLAMGAVLSGTDPEHIESIERIGELFGIIFQIKDDELGLFGDEQSLGKPLGSDIKEGKKTLYHHFLYDLSPPSVQGELNGIFGNPAISGKELDQIRTMIGELGIQSRIDTMIDKLTEELRRNIRSAQGLTPEAETLLLELTEYSVSRKR